MSALTMFFAQVSSKAAKLSRCQTLEIYHPTPSLYVASEGPAVSLFSAGAQ